MNWLGFVRIRFTIENLHGRTTNSLQLLNVCFRGWRKFGESASFPRAGMHKYRTMSAKNHLQPRNLWFFPLYTHEETQLVGLHTAIPKKCETITHNGVSNHTSMQKVKQQDGNETQFWKATIYLHEVDAQFTAVCSKAFARQPTHFRTQAMKVKMAKLISYQINIYWHPFTSSGAVW